MSRHHNELDLVLRAYLTMVLAASLGKVHRKQDAFEGKHRLLLSMLTEANADPICSCNPLFSIRLAPGINLRHLPRPVGGSARLRVAEKADRNGRFQFGHFQSCTSGISSPCFVM